MGITPIGGAFRPHSEGVAVDFQQKMMEIGGLYADLEESAAKAQTRERGWKAANGRVRQTISALRAALPELRKLSLELDQE
jgi:hypothetical protein